MTTATWPETCPRCGGPGDDHSFDRSICPCDDAMHSRCRKCGYPLDGCELEYGPQVDTSLTSEQEPSDA